MNLEYFLDKEKGKQVVLVQGLGFVGSVMSLVVANALKGDYAVIGVDQDTDAGRKTVDLLNSGTFPIVADDPKIKEYFDAACKRGNFFATVDPVAYTAADIIIVDINLDVRKTSDDAYALTDYSVNLNPFIAAMKTIGNHCKPDALVLVETTVPPGTCRNIVAPTIKAALEERGLPVDQIRIGHSYERVMPGPDYVDSIQNYYRVYSGIDEASADAVEAFLKTIIRVDEYPLTRLGNTNATEMAKVLENSYRAMNIAFAVEWSRMAEEAGVDLYEIVHAIRHRPTHKNLMLPGIGVGGYCLTKDPLLASWARTNLIGGKERLAQSEKAVSINDQMPRYAYEFLEKRYSKPLEDVKILLLGVSYRGDVGDTRFSPVEFFCRCLLHAKAAISTHDPYVPVWSELDIRPHQQLSEALRDQPDIAVISAGHRIYGKEETIDALLECKPMWIYDTIGLLSIKQINKLQQKHKVIILGRGDL
ncbi:MAG: nucleotide sugar dehydrogenase [Prevotellaceae bacterium]|jgi:nucleotide sugar dehydrogenase|nr:nucleotide sugar dehydrogenase [Prevotellaceae bacterium]